MFSLYGVLIIKLMKENDVTIYSDNTIDISSESFDKDFDEIDWNPKTEDDSDEEAKELFDY